MATIIAIAIVSARSMIVIQNQMAASQHIHTLLPYRFAFILTRYNEGDCGTTSTFLSALLWYRLNVTLRPINASANW